MTITEQLAEALSELMSQPTEHPLRMTPDQRRSLWAAHAKARTALASFAYEAGKAKVQRADWRKEVAEYLDKSGFIKHEASRDNRAKEHDEDRLLEIAHQAWQDKWDGLEPSMRECTRAALAAYEASKKPRPEPEEWR